MAVVCQCQAFIREDQDSHQPHTRVMVMYTKVVARHNLIIALIGWTVGCKVGRVFYNEGVAKTSKASANLVVANHFWSSGGLVLWLINDATR